MKRITKMSVACICATVLAFGCLGTAVADTVTLNSKNRIRVVNPDGTGDDAIFDAADLTAINNNIATAEQNVLDGKNAIATAITSADLAAPTKAGTVYTFTELATGVNPWDDLQAGLGFYSKDSEGNYTKGSTKRTTLYDSVNSIESLDKAIADDNISYRDEGKQEVVNNPASYGLCGGSIEVIKVGSGTVTVPNAATAYKFYIFGYGLSINGEYTSGWKYDYLLRPGDIATSISCGYMAMGIAPYGDRIYVCDVTDNTMARATAMLSWDGDVATLSGPSSNYSLPVLLGVK